MFFQTLVIAEAPHTLCDFVEKRRTNKFCQQGRYFSIMKMTTGPLYVTRQKVLSKLLKRTRFSICAQPFSEIQEPIVEPELRKNARERNPSDVGVVCSHTL